MCRCTGYTGLAAAGEAILRERAPAGGTARIEDSRLLSGRGDFIGGRRAAGQLWATVVRATVPHATITGVALADARAVPGVIAVFTTADLPESLRHLHEDLPGPAEPVLAADAVRYAGQPVALVVAGSAAAAEDAAEAVTVSYAPRPLLPAPTSVADLPPDDDPGWLALPPQNATAPPGPDAPGTDAPGTDAPAAVVRETFTLARQTGMPMETRGLLAEWDARRRRLTVHGVTKHPAANRAHLARALGLDADQVVTPPGDVGGAFGVKGEMYPEDLLIPWAAAYLERPVMWLEDRGEHMVATNHSRGQLWQVEMSADRTGRILAARVDVVADAGAYVRPLTTLMPSLAAAMFPGPYAIPSYRATARALMTNRTPIGPVRAPGRVEANFVRERMLDMLAARLDIDPVTLRRRNLLGAEDMPYDVGTINEGPVHYDSADVRTAYDRAVAAATADRSAGATAHERPDDGWARGTAVVPFIDKAGLGDEEIAVATLRAGGVIEVDAAAAPSGQGHETTLAKVAAAAVGVPVEMVTVNFAGSPGSAAAGLGTFASRTMMHTGNAVHLACRDLRKRLLAAVAADPADANESADATESAEPAHPADGWTLEEGVIRAPDGRAVSTLARLAGAHPEGLTGHGRYAAGGHTYPYGAVTCSVAIEPELFQVRVEKLAISCDAGTVIDRDIVIGQLAGGLAQGVSAALLEELPYDAAGLPMAAGLEHYPLPLAGDVPPIEVTLLEPSAPTAMTAYNPLGVKGVGEAGTAAGAAAVAGAVRAALPRLTAHLNRLPLTPSRLLTASMTAARSTPRPAGHARPSDPLTTAR